MSSTRTYPGAVINSDLEKLNNSTISQQFKEDLESKLADINNNDLSNDNA